MSERLFEYVERVYGIRAGENVTQCGTQKENVVSEQFRGRVMVARFEPVRWRCGETERRGYLPDRRMHYFAFSLGDTIQVLFTRLPASLCLISQENCFCSVGA